MTTLGSIQSSMFDYDDFQAQHGGGWFPCTGVDLLGTDLYELTGLAKTPDFRDKFIRNVGGNAADFFLIQPATTSTKGASFEYNDVPISVTDDHNHGLGGKGDTQAGKYPDIDLLPYEINSLRHYWNSPNTIKSYVWSGTKKEGNAVAKTTQSSGFSTWNTEDLQINLTGGFKTKPKEITVYYYIRVRNMPEDGNSLPPEVLE